MRTAAMKFVVHGVRQGCRWGSITELASHAGKTIDTPMCMLYTRTGSVPHLTRDMLDRVGELPLVAHMPLPLWAEQQEVLQAYKQGVGGFSAMQDFLVYCSVQDPAVVTPSGYNDKAASAVWGRGGKVRLDVDQYMCLQEACKPDWFQALCDGDSNKDTSKKRLRKSVDRTLQYLDGCLHRLQTSERLQGTEILGVVEGGYCIDERLRSAKETIARPVAGFVIEGFHNNGPETETFQLEEIADILQETVAVLPEDKPRLMHGIWRPESVLQAVLHGIDLFDSSYPYIVTQRGAALVFNFQLPQPPPEGDDNQQNGEEAVEEKPVYEINLKDKRYAEDFSGLLAGCPCYTCQSHSRAYINHLLNTSELLASVLLMIHNCHHYFAFFKALREALAQDKFQLFKEQILKHSR